MILNIYFDYTHIMCLYRVLSVHCTSYTLVNITYGDITLPKRLSFWVRAQLCYINSSTSLFFLHVRLPLTHVYPTISHSHVSHYFSLGFETSFLGPRLAPPCLWAFSFSCVSSIGISYAIHEHVSSPHSYSWEPDISISMETLHSTFFLDLAPLATLFVGSCMGFKYTHPVPSLSTKGTLFPLYLRNEHS